MSKLAPSVQSLVCWAQDVGDEPYQASVMKITGNFFIVSCVETIAEGMTLAEKNGISRCIETETSHGQASCCLLTYAAQNKQLQFCHVFASMGMSCLLCQADCAAVDSCCVSHRTLGTRDSGSASSLWFTFRHADIGPCLTHIMFLT